MRLAPELKSNIDALWDKFSPSRKRERAPIRFDSLKLIQFPFFKSTKSSE